MVNPTRLEAVLSTVHAVLSEQVPEEQLDAWFSLIAKGRAEGPTSPYYVNELGLQQVATGVVSCFFVGGSTERWRATYFADYDSPFVHGMFLYCMIMFLRL